MTRKQPLSIITAALALVTLIVALVLIGPDFNLDFNTEYISILPSLLLVIVGVLSISKGQGYTTIGGFLMLGIGFAIMTDTLNTLGILIPDMITPALTLGNIQLLIVIFSAIIGAVFSK